MAKLHSKDELEQFENSKEIYFSDCFKFEKTYSYSRDYEVNFSNLHHVHYGDIHTKFPNIITKDITLPHIKNEKKNYVTLLPGDIVVADASEDHKDLGKSVLFEDAERNVIAGLHTHFLRNNNNIIDSKYYLYFTKTDTYIGEMRRLGTGISVLGISKTNLSKIKIPYESLENQIKIAATLSQIDNLIKNSKNIIHTYKQAIDSLIIQLFSNSKSTTLLSNLAEVISGGTPSTSNLQYWNGDIEWFTPSEVGENKYIKYSKRKISKLGLLDSSAKLIQPNSILLTTRATIGETSINLIECTTNQGFQTIQPYLKLDTDFLYYQIKFLRNILLKKSSGSTFLEINNKEIKNLSVSTYPQEVREKIGRTLSQMDNSTYKTLYNRSLLFLFRKVKLFLLILHILC